MKENLPPTSSPYSQFYDGPTTFKYTNKYAKWLKFFNYKEYQKKAMRPRTLQDFLKMETLHEKVYVFTSGSTTYDEEMEKWKK